MGESVEVGFYENLGLPQIVGQKGKRLLKRTLADTPIKPLGVGVG